MKIFFQVMFVWQDLVFSAEFEKIALQKKQTNKKQKKQQHNNCPLLYTQVLKLSMIRLQYLVHRERIHRSFIKQ